MGYEWHTATEVNNWPPRPPAAPKWYSVLTPVLILTCPGPSSADATLVRTEVAAYITAIQIDADSGFGFDFATSMHCELRGDVYGSGSTTIPDPSQTGQYEFAFTSSLDTTPSHVYWGGTTLIAYSAWLAQTRGYETSKARRGPDRYGGGTAQFNLGLFVDNCAHFELADSRGSSSWRFVVRTLWQTH